MTGLLSVLVPIDGVTTLVATHVDPVLKSAAFFACEIAYSMVNCWDGDTFPLSVIPV